MINIFYDLTKWVFKKAKQPSSTNALLSVLLFAGVNDPELLTNAITQIVAGSVAVYSFFKDDKSE
jgi:hypothetical protein